MKLLNFPHLLWLVIFSQLFANCLGFFPFLGNVFNRFRNNQNGNNFGGGNGQSNGGVSLFSTAASANTGTGNVTSIVVPMLSTPQRRVDVVTTVVRNAPIDSDLDRSGSSSETSNSTSAQEQIMVKNNVTTTNAAGANLTIETRSDQDSLSTIQRLIIPTSTSVTSSVSAIQEGLPLLLNQGQGQLGAPNTLTLPFTPNLFGMMAYVQAFKDIKHNYKSQEWARKLMFHNKEGGDLMTRILRTLIQKVVNKYQKGTEMLKLKIIKRQDKLQKFLQLPMVSQVIAMDHARGVNNGILQSVALGNAGAGIVVPAASVAPHSLPFFRKPVSSILGSFLIR